ncbi:CBM35 domain-containing protein [Actinacidiphila acididurans]|uniref:Carbohydrate-binding protein n=1 Tax=Actinacidiphila acididurans TaxID=2784346 RepID=A0ABS2TPD3_9ACTN|nr:CBM35 domain-containing protein [Actinacidiphila acididurans]MBM9505202.1 carbohydrate-binding protein [Actinacidiphila acididurans]
MTAGHDGTPENDDPFGYLYRSEGGEQPDPSAGQPAQPGVPRTSYHQVQRVGERRSPQAPGGYGYPPQGYDQGGQGPGGQGGYGYPPQQQPYGGATREFAGPGQPPPQGGGHRGGAGGQAAPNRKGLLIAAVAVVAAVAVGIAVAMANGSGDTGKQSAADGKQTGAPAATAPTSAPPSTSASPTATPFDSKQVDASTLTLGGGAQKSNQWPGASAAGGTYVDHMGAVGASVTWNVTVPEDGPYTFFINYGNAGQDANLTLVVNGTPRTDPVNLKNYGSYTDWSKAWRNHTYNFVDLKAGANTLTLSCSAGQNCGVNLDQVELKKGQVTNY